MPLCAQKELNATVCLCEYIWKRKTVANKREKLCEFVLLNTKTNNEHRNWAFVQCKKKEEN